MARAQTMESSTPLTAPAQEQDPTPQDPATPVAEGADGAQPATAAPEHPGLGKKDFTVPGVGVFRMKVPDAMTRLDIAVRKGALQRGQNADTPEEAQEWAYVRAVIDVCCEVFPTDFDWAEQYDWAPFMTMVVAWMDWESDFRRHLAARKARRSA